MVVPNSPLPGRGLSASVRTASPVVSLTCTTGYVFGRDWRIAVFYSTAEFFYWCGTWLGLAMLQGNPLSITCSFKIPFPFENLPSVPNSFTSQLSAIFYIYFFSHYLFLSFFGSSFFAIFLMLSATGKFSGMVPPSSCMVFLTFFPTS